MNRYIGLKQSIPVFFGYLPLGAAFGLLFVSELDYPAYFAVLMGLFIFAGSAQFLSIGLIANNAGLIEVGIAIFLLNARHIFYGISLVAEFRLTGVKRWYTIFALTDETFSLIASLPEPYRRDQELFWKLALLNQLYWVMGCALGAFIGLGIALPNIGLEFVLPALFMVLCVEQYRTNPNARLMSIALIIALFSLWIWAEQMLILSIVLSLILVVLGYKGRTWNR